MAMRTTISLTLCLAACASPLPPPSLVDSLRVLAVRADPPIATPGAEVTLDLLIADPHGADRPLAIGWAGCLDPTGGDPASCFDERRATRLGDGPVARLVVPADALDGASETLFGVAALVCAGGQIEWGPGRPTCVGGQEELFATKRVRVAAETASNPTMGRISFGGIETAEDGEVLRINPCSLMCGATRVSLGVDGPDPSSLWTAFGATAGEFDVPFVDGTRPTSFWSKPESGGSVQFYFVVRDDRGGVAWSVRDVLVVEGVE